MLFVIVQLACSQPVLVVTSLVLADLRAGANVNAVHAPASVITMRSEMRRPKGAVTNTDLPALISIGDRLGRVPGVVSVALSTEGVDRASLFTLGKPTEFATAAGSSRIRQLHVNAGYFSTLGMRVTRGRVLGADEERAGSTAVVVNEGAAAALWPGADPVGKRLVRRDQDGRESAPLEVIGVVSAAPYDGPEVTPMLYAPLATASSGWIASVAVRTRGGARAYLPQLRAAIRDVESYAALSDISTLAEQYEAQRREAVESNAAALSIGIVALLLASLGLYAIIAFAVAQRTREIGVRLAMGATPGRVVREFFTSGLLVSATGLAIGLPVTIVGIRLVKASVLGFTIHDIATVLLVIPVLLAVAALASWLPAHRAGRVDPLIALRAE